MHIVIALLPSRISVPFVPPSKDFRKTVPTVEMQYVLPLLSVRVCVALVI
jgi:hypothetical protein